MFCSVQYSVWLFFIFVAILLYPFRFLFQCSHQTMLFVAFSIISMAKRRHMNNESWTQIIWRENCTIIDANINLWCIYTANRKFWCERSTRKHFQFHSFHWFWHVFSMNTINISSNFIQSYLTFNRIVFDEEKIYLLNPPNMICVPHARNEEETAGRKPLANIETIVSILIRF